MKEGSKDHKTVVEDILARQGTFCIDAVRAEQTKSILPAWEYCHQEKILHIGQGDGINQDAFHLKLACLHWPLVCSSEAPPEISNRW